MAYWSLELIFKAKIRKPKIPIWLLGSYFGSNIAEKQYISAYGHNQHAH